MMMITNYQTNKLYDVAVVGAGPSGNYAAMTMAESGLDVVVFDQRDKIGDKLCTGIVGEECLSLFPADPDIIKGKISSINLFSPKGGSHRIEEDIVSAWILDRRAYVENMAIQAKHLGARYLIGERVERVNIDDECVTLETSKGICLRSRAILVSSGFGTNILTQVGLKKYSVKKFLQASQTMVEFCSSYEDRTDIKVFIEGERHPGAFTWLVPTNNQYGLLGSLYRAGDENPMSRYKSKIETRKLNITKIGKIENWGVPIEPIPKTFGCRVLVSGDAAGFTKPTTGGGIFYSMLSGGLAAETMIKAFALNDFSSEIFCLYQGKWEEKFGKELLVGMVARNLLESLNDEILDSLINKFAVNIQTDLLRYGNISFDWHSTSIFQILKNRDVLELIGTIGPKAPMLVAKILAAKAKNLVNF